VGEEFRTYRWGAGQTTPKQRFTVAEAAEVLQLSAEAVRSRVKRGSLESAKEGNTVYVLLDADQARPNPAQTSDQTMALITNLQDQVEYLRGELARREETHLEESRRKDSIIAALTQRIPEIEAPAPQEAGESPQTADEQQGRGEPHPDAPGAQGGVQRRPWWRRVFGG
jgi:hypothetical protein